jgi:hypothetical protein
LIYIVVVHDVQDDKDSRVNQDADDADDADDTAAGPSILPKVMTVQV